MTTYTTIISIFWAAFIIYWIVSAISSKKNIRRGSGAWIRLVTVVIFFIIFNTPGFQSFIAYYNSFFSHPMIALLGVLFTALGLAFAIWARIYLGKNWGMPMSLKENVELVTTGPYAYVRHPIYTGMLVATFGSALAGGAWWLFFFIFFAVYFIFSARTEEEIMTEQFPNVYPEYKKRTKMLIPFVF